MYVAKRPQVDEFLVHMTKIYEVVIFTASLAKYAEPLMDRLDKTGYGYAKLFREHCTFYNGLFVKDLSKLGRPLKDIIIIDVSASPSLLRTRRLRTCSIRRTRSQPYPGTATLAVGSCRYSPQSSRSWRPSTM